MDKVEGNGFAKKIGQAPEVHVELPSNLATLLGTDFEYFTKGLKAEKNGLGVGAAAYYRRVVENQKGRLIKQIRKVAKRLGANQDVLDRFERAANETQFKKAVDLIKDVFPQSLLNDGHNPLTLLHNVLSIVLHKEPDSSCLKVAHSIRMILTDLATRMKEALREDREVKQALADLLNFKPVADPGTDGA